MKYPEVSGAIRAKYGKQELFAKDMGMHPVTLSMKLRGKRDWTRAEMELACRLLDLPVTVFFDF